MSDQGFNHKPVLLDEVIAALEIKPDGVYVDGTYGRGGHSEAILSQLNENGRLLVMDKDPQAIADALQKHAADKRVTVIHDDYAQMAEHMNRLGLQQLVDGVLLDLGVSSPQLDDASRGFSFQNNGPLDMRMNPQVGQSAADWIMSASEKEISDVLWQLGEERYARRIARKVIEVRQEQPISDTQTLAELIRSCVPANKEKKHPATRSFQAIRININQELEHVQDVLEGVFDILRVGGRVLVISFHSLEDRIVKRFFKKHSQQASLPRGLPLREKDIPVTIRLKAIGKAIKATRQELIDNARSRSAVLRIAERVV